MENDTEIHFSSEHELQPATSKTRTDSIGIFKYLIPQIASINQAKQLSSICTTDQMAIKTKIHFVNSTLCRRWVIHLNFIGITASCGTINAKFFSCCQYSDEISFLRFNGGTRSFNDRIICCSGPLETNYFCGVMGGKLSKKSGNSPAKPDASKRNSKIPSTKTTPVTSPTSTPVKATSSVAPKQESTPPKSGPESAKLQPPSTTQPTATDRTSSTTTSVNDASISKEREDIGDELVHEMNKVNN